MRVRKNGVYVYQPCLLDIVDARTILKAGDRVRVIQLPCAPPPNTMGQCHIEDLSGKFLGMVSTKSLICE